MIPKNLQKAKFQVFNDGVLWICEQVRQESSFGAVKNAVEGDDITKLIKMDYAEMSARDQDLQYAESIGRTLSLKVRCRLKDGVKKTHLVMIGDMLYSIVKLDYDRTNGLMFLYLEEVRRLTNGN